MFGLFLQAAFGVVTITAAVAYGVGEREKLLAAKREAILEKQRRLLAEVTANAARTELALTRHRAYLCHDCEHQLGIEHPIVEDGMNGTQVPLRPFIKAPTVVALPRASIVRRALRWR